MPAVFHRIGHKEKTGTRRADGGTSLQITQRKVGSHLSIEGGFALCIFYIVFVTFSLFSPKVWTKKETVFRVVPRGTFTLNVKINLSSLVKAAHAPA